jgi:hypothetical protein
LQTQVEYWKTAFNNVVKEIEELKEDKK